MKTTRRGALIVITGSSLTLLTDTLGFSSAKVERDVRIDVVGDDRALLRLTDEEIEVDGILFEGEEPRKAPEPFAITNQLTQPIELTLELEPEGELVFIDGGRGTNDPDGVVGEIEADGNRVVIDELPVGEMIEEVTLDVTDIDPDESNPKAATIVITAEGGGVSVYAERDLALVDDGPDDPDGDFDLAMYVCRGKSSICVGLFLVVESAENEDGDDVSLVVSDDDGERTLGPKELEPGGEVAFDDIRPQVPGRPDPGNWNVTSADPYTSAVPDPDDSGPGDPVELQVEIGEDVYVVTVDPGAAGATETIEVTVAAPDSDD